MSNRTDPQGYSTKVTRLGKGYGIRVLRNGKILSQESVDTRGDIGPAIRETLRMMNKCGSPSEMADASRHRRYCR